MCVVIVNSVGSQNRLPWVLNPDLAELPGLAFETLARVDRALEFVVDDGHGIDCGINPTALKGIGTSGSDVLIKICLLGRAVWIGGGVGTKIPGRVFVPYDIILWYVYSTKYRQMTVECTV